MKNVTTKKIDFDKHPCFNKDSKHKFARVHLPVAPKCNVQCKFCNRKYDCVNESRPGVTSSVLSPEQALAYLDHYVEKIPVAVAGIAGPGDPFANPEETMETLRLIRAKYPEMILCVSTNGMNILPYVEELAEIGVSHVTITVCAIDPEIAAQVYAWVRPDKKPYRGIDAGKMVVETQAKAMKAIKDHDIVLKINSIIVPTVNEHHIIDIAKYAKSVGADLFNAISLIPTEGSDFENLEAPSAEMANSIKREAAEYLPVMQHCARCRADAVGLLGEKHTEENVKTLADFSKLGTVPQGDRPYIAVATNEGMLINQHLGEANQLHIYGMENDEVVLIDTRYTPAVGGGDARWKEMAGNLHDCKFLLASGAGEAPQKNLSKYGLTVVVTDGVIEEVVEDIFAGKGTAHLKKTPSVSCGSGCGGNGMGCG